MKNMKMLKNSNRSMTGSIAQRGKSLPVDACVARDANIGQDRCEEVD